MSDEQLQPIIVKRGRKAKHGHHGGAWKVAYADFVTAMMAFFLVMWLLGVGTREQKAAVSEYFKNPSNTPGTATLAPPGKIGPGGASDSAIQLGGAMDLPRGPGKDKHGAPVAAKGAGGKQNQQEAEKMARAQEKARLEELKQELNAAIQSSQAMAPFKDQLLIDITPEGLRIQIVDKLNRPMFDTGSAALKPYTVKILHELAQSISKVPNKISLAGHTDDAPYSSDHNYSNWELSADRANAARRALIGGGLDVDRIARVVGLAAAVPFDKANPGNPINRRISIIVMTREAEQAARSQEMADAGPAAPASTAAPAAAVSAPATASVAMAADGSKADAPSLPALPPAIRPATPSTPVPTIVVEGDKPASH